MKADEFLAKFKLIQAFMIFLIICRNEEDSTNTSPIISLLGFFQTSGAANSSVPCPMVPNFKPNRDLMVVLVTCKNKEEPIKSEEAKVVTRFFPL